MKIFYDYDCNKILTEEEAKESARQNVLNDTYALLEFIENNKSISKKERNTCTAPSQNKSILTV